MGRQSVQHQLLCHSPPHTLLLLHCGGPCHGRQSFINFSNHSHRLQVLNCPTVVPSHLVQYFRNHYVLHGSSLGSPWGHKSCQPTWAPLSMGPQVQPEPAPLWAFHGGYSLFCTSMCFNVWDPSQQASGSLSDPQWISMGYRGTAVSLLSLPQIAGESLLQCLEHLLALLLHWPQCLLSFLSLLSWAAAAIAQFYPPS